MQWGWTVDIGQGWQPNVPIVLELTRLNHKLVSDGFMTSAAV